jgi:predicted  nucleic acid-binding Zn-ribbon protein
MTELEKHLLAGFDRLAKQYEREQLHSAEQVKALSLQVSDLSQQVKTLNLHLSDSSKRVEQLTQLHTTSEAKLRQDLQRTFDALNEQLKQLSES